MSAKGKLERQDGVGQCRTCGEFCILGRHRCDPLWKVWMPECGQSEEDAVEVYAKSPDRAAEEFCQREDAKGDYDIIRSGEATVMLRSASGGPVFTARVRAESVPEYHAEVTEVTG